MILLYRLSISYLFLNVTAIVILSFCSFINTLIPAILDAVNPLNESRSRVLLVNAKFMIDPAEYYFSIQLNFLIYFIACFLITSSIYPLVITVIYHFAGLVSVVKLVDLSYELKGVSKLKSQ